MLRIDPRRKEDHCSGEEGCDGDGRVGSLAKWNSERKGNRKERKKRDRREKGRRGNQTRQEGKRKLSKHERKQAGDGKTERERTERTEEDNHARGEENQELSKHRDKGETERQRNREDLYRTNANRPEGGLEGRYTGAFGILIIKQRKEDSSEAPLGQIHTGQAAESAWGRGLSEVAAWEGMREVAAMMLCSHRCLGMRQKSKR